MRHASHIILPRCQGVAIRVTDSFHTARRILSHLHEHLPCRYRRGRYGICDGFARSTGRRPWSHTPRRDVRTRILPKGVECRHYSCHTHQFQSLKHQTSLLTWIHDRVNVELCARIKDGLFTLIQNSSCPVCRARLIKSSLDWAAVNAARNRIRAAYRLERQILNGDGLRSTDYGY